MWDETFARLPDLNPGDLVYLTTATDTSLYIVNYSRKIATSDTRPLRDCQLARLTLYTCVLPFDPRHRWIVQASLRKQFVKKGSHARQKKVTLPGPSRKV